MSSLAWVDDIVVVDNGSTDNTRGIAQKQGATVISSGKTRDFAKLRNIGKEKAHGEWLLYIDADETVTQELAKEIKKAVSGQRSAGMKSEGKIITWVTSGRETSIFFD